MSRRLLPVWCAAVAAVLGVGGCSGASSAQFATPSTMPTSSSATSGLDAVSNARLLPNTSEGAKRFAELYLATSDQAVASGNTVAVRALLSPGCGCTSTFDQVDKYTRAGQHFVGFHFVYSNVAVNFQASSAVVSYFVSATAGSLLDAAGATVMPLPSATARSFLMHVRWQADTGWLVDQVEQR
jgi:hypothetical protein